jgi:hypothetical protein
MERLICRFSPLHGIQTELKTPFNRLFLENRLEPRRCSDYYRRNRGLFFALDLSR